jgi:hypothetical protein
MAVMRLSLGSPSDSLIYRQKPPYRAAFLRKAGVICDWEKMDFIW